MSHTMYLPIEPNQPFPSVVEVQRRNADYSRGRLEYVPRPAFEGQLDAWQKEALVLRDENRKLRELSLTLWQWARLALEGFDPAEYEAKKAMKDLGLDV